LRKHSSTTLSAIDGSIPITLQDAFQKPGKLCLTLSKDRVPSKEQKTVTVDGQEALLAAKGRHDPCVLPRAVPMVEAMAAMILMDHMLCQQALSPR
jgi:Chorismate synthase